jgi:hypothetical protein
MRVQYNGVLYENNWYSQNQNPEQNSSEFSVWTNLGACQTGTTPTPVPNTPTPVPNTPTPVPNTPTPVPNTPTPGQVTPTPQAGQGTISFSASSYSTGIGGALDVPVYVNTGNQNVAAYGLSVSYNSSVLSVDSSQGSSGVSAGTDGFVSAVNDLGNALNISGFEANGKGPSTNLHLITLHFIGEAQGSSTLSISVSDLTDSAYATIGNPSGGSATVSVSNQTLGDVNGDGSITIVDALMAAQYYVGLAPAGYNAAAGDVNCDGTRNIVDALVIAQYYVGLLTSFPC